MAQSCRFARRNPCSRSRFTHPFFVVAEPTEPETSTESNNTGETFWHQLLEMVDDGILEYVRQKSMKEQEQPKDNKPNNKYSCRVHRNSIDPVPTIVHNKPGKFVVTVPLKKHNVKPEDLSVGVKERDLIITIKIEKTSEDGTSQLSQVFTKKIALPDDAKLEEVKSFLTPEGVLKVEVALPVPEEPKSVDIPVSVEKSAAAAAKSSDVDIEFPAVASE